MITAYNFISSWQLFPEKGTYELGNRPKSGIYKIEATDSKKEIAIRQTFGAGIGQIIITLFKNIFFLILIASLIAAPITYWAYSIWIQDFAFQVDLNYLIFHLQ